MKIYTELYNETHTESHIISTLLDGFFVLERVNDGALSGMQKSVVLAAFDNKEEQVAYFKQITPNPAVHMLTSNSTEMNEILTSGKLRVTLPPQHYIAQRL